MPKFILKFADGSRDPRKVTLENEEEVEVFLPALPEDAAEKTYALQAVNGVLTWVEVPAEAAE